MQGTKQTEIFHLIRDEQGNRAGTDSALSFLHKEIPACIPEFVLAADEKEMKNLHLYRFQFKVIQINKIGKLWKTLQVLLCFLKLLTLLLKNKKVRRSFHPHRQEDAWRALVVHRDSHNGSFVTSDFPQVTGWKSTCKVVCLPFKAPSLAHWIQSNLNTYHWFWASS